MPEPEAIFKACTVHRSGGSQGDFPESSASIKINKRKAVRSFWPSPSVSKAGSASGSRLSGRRSKEVLHITEQRGRNESFWGKPALFKVAQNPGEISRTCTHVFSRSSLPLLLPALKVRLCTVYAVENED